MSIEVAVLLATVAVGALWAGVLGTAAVINDLHHRRRLAAVARRIEEAPKTGRHRLVAATGRHHLRVGHQQLQVNRDLHRLLVSHA
jgi:hypothetical protein